MDGYEKVNNKIQVSIIIPAYNAEKTIEKCLESALCQTYKNIEIIVIDDGSIDETPRICDDIAVIYKNVKVYHISNSGAAVARNYGIEKASGDYIQFIDSDDTIEISLTEQLYLSMINYQVDISLCGFNLFSGDIRHTIKPKRGKADIKSFTDIMEYWLISPIIGSPCNKLYSRKIIEENNIRFPNGILFAEDYIFNIIYFKYVTSFFCVDKSLYNYHIDSLNSLHKINGENIEERWERCEEIIINIELMLKKHGIYNEKLVSNMFSYLLVDNLIYRIKRNETNEIKFWMDSVLENKKYIRCICSSSILVRHPRATIVIKCLKNIIKGICPELSFFIIGLLYRNKFSGQQ